MKTKIYIHALASLLLLGSATSCIEEIDPQQAYATEEQVSSAPNAFDNAVAATYSTLTGEFLYSASSMYPFDFGITSFMLIRDVMGQDIASRADWYSYWSQCYSLTTSSGVTQFPWTLYYSWIKNCNTAISLARTDFDETKYAGLAQALAIRSMLYYELAVMYGSEAYGINKDALTVPIVDEETTLDELANNPNGTNEEIFNFIISSLDEAEQYVDATVDTDPYTVDISVIYGLKARAYLYMEDWANAEKYAKLAYQNYSIMDEATYTSFTTGFNTPSSSWILGTLFEDDDPNILENDADSSWGSQMCIEIDPDASGCGYAANYGQPNLIDRHLYETIPSSDFRKKTFVDFAIDDLETYDEMLDALSAYSDHPDWLYNTALVGNDGLVGGLELKFRTANGESGRASQKLGFLVAVPLMRAEEMMLIEAEAAGMQDQSRGIELLTAFATTRDPEYTYGTHNESTYGGNCTAFQNEVWWQRRVELWGEGFTVADIKRLNKNVIRSYANTNHSDGYQWNTSGPAEWMSLPIPQTETNYNTSCISNPAPTAPSGNSSPVSF